MPLDFNLVEPLRGDIPGWYYEEIRRAVGDAEYWRVERVDADADDAESQPEADAGEPQPDAAAAGAEAPHGKIYRQVKSWQEVSDYIGDIARRILGTEIHAESTRETLRFGHNRGSIAVEIDGPKKGTWYDHTTSEGGGVLQLIIIKGGVAKDRVADWLADNFGIEIEGHKSRRRIVASYIYRDEKGVPLAKKDRWEPKNFSWKRADGAGGWKGKKDLNGERVMDGVRRLIYRLPEVTAAPADAVVYWVEGEKDADAGAARLGLITTCNPDGGSAKSKTRKPAKWRPEFGEQVGRRNIVVIPDNDEVGLPHARTVSTQLARAGCAVRIVRLPHEIDGLKVKDLSDWIEAGGTLEQLEALVADAPVFDPLRDASSRDDAADEQDKAQEGEVLPSFESVHKQAQALTKDSSPAAVNDVIAQIAAGRFSHTEEDRLISQIQAQTGIGLRALRGDLKKAKEQQPKPPPPPATAGKWELQLILNDQGEPRSVMANVVIALIGDLSWAGVLAMNEFTDAITLRSAPPWHKGAFTERPWTDQDTRRATYWMQQHGIPAPSHVVFEGIQAAAENSPFHPVKIYLGPLVWDKTPRLDDLFISYYGALGEAPGLAEYPDLAEGQEEAEKWNRRRDYYRAIGPRFLISAVARIYQPGCKSDCMPNLVGPQGALKSSSLRTLFSSSWFTDEIADLGSKDAAMQTAGVWCIEISELAAMSRVTIERVKAWLSRQVDRFRPPYGKAIKEQPRQSVAAGTTNDDTFLVDDTGNRRSWAVTCGTIDIDRLKADRDQLWAEAVARYRRGEKWWLHEKELIATAAEVQAEFVEEDIWTDAVLDYVQHLPSIGLPELLRDCIKIRIEDQTEKQAKRVASILRKAGWTRKRAKVGGRLTYRFFSHNTQRGTGNRTGNS